MNLYTQAARPLSVVTPLGQDALLLEELQGTEAVSELFHFRLDLLAAAGTPVPFDKVLVQRVTALLAMPDGSRRYVNGIVNRFTEGPTVPGARGRGSFTRYRAEVVPQLWLLTKRVRSRIFQQKSVPDILKEVLAGLDVDFRLQGEFHPRDYCVQYRESDFAFACRLLEDEGIAYFFCHRDGGHTLVLSNDAQGHPYVPGPSRLLFEAVAGEVRPDDRVVFWEKTQELRAGKYTAWDYSFQMPAKNLGATAKPPGPVQAGAVTHHLDVGGSGELELFDYPGGYAHRVDGVGPNGNDQSGQLEELFSDNARTARLRMEEETCAAVSVAGESTCRQLTAGHKFALNRHVNGNGPYVLTRVEHSASLRGAYTADPRAALDYHNRFQGVPAALPYRPARATPRPCIVGPQTAVVVGPPGEDVFTDKFGRIKVQFFWDRHGKHQSTTRNGNSVIPLQYWGAGNGAANPTCSCWVRVAQNWAGRGWGGMVIPRIGQEVVIGFQDGDPDRPLCLGCVYNNANLPPLPLPERAMDTALKTSSVGGGTPNFSGLAFHDTLGEEHVQLHSERDLTLMAEQHKVVNVGVNHHVNVGNTQMIKVGALPGGSGGGGGDVTYNGIFNWEIGDSSNPDISATLGKNLQLIYGEQTSAVAGLACSWTFGSYTQVVVNPLAAAGSIPSPIFQAPAAVLAGQAYYTIGSLTTLTYGMTLTMNRGPEVVVKGETPRLTQSLATLAAFLGVDDIMLAGMLNPEDTAAKVSELGLLGVDGLVLCGLAASELYNAVKGIITVTTTEAEEAEQAQNLNVMKGALTQLMGAANLAAAGEAPLPGGAIETQAGLMDINTGPYTLSANTLSLTGTSGTTLAAGDADNLATLTYISMNPDPLVGLSLEQYDPAVHPLITLDSAGITIAVGKPGTGPQITLSPLPNQGLTLAYGPPNAGCRITLNAQGITLSYGPPDAGCSIALNAAGITLKVGATTSIKLIPEGVQIDGLEFGVIAQNSFAVNTGDLTEIVEGEISRTAASQSYQ
jgi:type VI secretion system secreted protein VgrG